MELWHNHGELKRNSDFCGGANKWEKREKRGGGWDRKSWWSNGQRHRIGGPAQDVKFPDGKVIKRWFENSNKIRESRYQDGILKEEKFYNLEGQLHRLDGPAKLEDYNQKYYYVNGEYFFHVDAPDSGGVEGYPYIHGSNGGLGLYNVSPYLARWRDAGGDLSTLQGDDGIIRFSA